MKNRTNDFLASSFTDAPGFSEEPDDNRPVLIASLALPLSLAIMIFFGGVLGGLWSVGAAGNVPDDVPSQIEAVREEIAAMQRAPNAVAWLNEALAPGLDGAEVLTYVRAALNEVVEAKDPALEDAATELRQIISELRPVTTNSVNSASDYTRKTP